VRGRTWDAALAQLAAGYDRALGRTMPTPALAPVTEAA
jgi:hypothetical protein